MAYHVGLSKNFLLWGNRATVQHEAGVKVIIYSTCKVYKAEISYEY